MPEVPLDAFAAAHADGAFVIDVREPAEYESGHLPGALLTPGVSPGHGLPRRAPVFVVCASGNRSREVAADLHAAGYDARSVAGGTAAWEASGRPVVRGPRANVA